MLILVDLYHASYDLWRYPIAYFNELKENFPSADFEYVQNRDDFLSLLPSADAIIGWRIEQEDFPIAKKLKWFHSMAAGIGSMFFDEFLKSDVILTNSAGVRAGSMADWIICCIISFAKRFPTLACAQKNKQWTRFDYWREINKVVDLEKSTVGIIGYGGIGREVGKRAKVIGMRVIGTKRNPDKGTEFADEIYPPGKLHEILPQSDFVVLSAPLTPETKKIISTPEFEIMKRTAYILNVGRGGLIDTPALITALNDKLIAGAALDVTDPEPPPDDCPLWDMQNVILTPHVSGIGPFFWEKSKRLLYRNIKAFLEGSPMENIVDKNLHFSVKDEPAVQTFPSRKVIGYN